MQKLPVNVRSRRNLLAEQQDPDASDTAHPELRARSSEAPIRGNVLLSAQALDD